MNKKFKKKIYICGDCKKLQEVCRYPRSGLCIDCYNKQKPYDEIVKFFKSNNCELLTSDNDYINLNTDINYKCKCGKICNTTVNNYYNSIYYCCSSCSKYLQFGSSKEERYDEIKQLCKDKGLILITPLENFTFSNEIEFQCEKNINHKPKINLNYVKDCKGCPLCYKEKRIITLDIVKKLFEDHNCILLSTEYKNNKQQLEFKCKKCTDTSIKQVTYMYAFKPNSKFIFCSNCE